MCSWTIEGSAVFSLGDGISRLPDAVKAAPPGPTRKSQAGGGRKEEEETGRPRGESWVQAVLQRCLVSKHVSFNISFKVVRKHCVRRKKNGRDRRKRRRQQERSKRRRRRRSANRRRRRRKPEGKQRLVCPATRQHAVTVLPELRHSVQAI